MGDEEVGKVERISFKDVKKLSHILSNYIARTKTLIVFFLDKKEHVF